MHPLTTFPSLENQDKNLDAVYEKALNMAPDLLTQFIAVCPELLASENITLEQLLLNIRHFITLNYEKAKTDQQSDSLWVFQKSFQALKKEFQVLNEMKKAITGLITALTSENLPVNMHLMLTHTFAYSPGAMIDNLQKYQQFLKLEQTTGDHYYGPITELLRHKFELDFLPLSFSIQQLIRELKENPFLTGKIIKEPPFDVAQGQKISTFLHYSSKIIPKLEEILAWQLQLEKKAQTLFLDLNTLLLSPDFIRQVMKKFRNLINKTTYLPEQILANLRQSWQKVLTQEKTRKEFHDKDQYQAIKELHRFGYSLTTAHADQNFACEKIWPTAPAIQIPCGVGSDPEKADHAHWPKNFEFVRLLMELELQARQDGVKRTLILFDTPQETNFYHFLNPTQPGKTAPRAYIEQVARAENKDPQSVAREKAALIGQHDVAYLRQIVKIFNLQQLAIKTFADIEAEPFFQDLKNTITEIIQADPELVRQLISTVDPRFKKRAGIDLDEKNPDPNLRRITDPQKKQQILWELASYGLKVVALHIYGLGDTIVHSAEEKNYRLTQKILHNSSWSVTTEELDSFNLPAEQIINLWEQKKANKWTFRAENLEKLQQELALQAITPEQKAQITQLAQIKYPHALRVLDVIQKYHPDCTAKQLSDLAEHGFIGKNIFEAATLDDKANPEIYTTHFNPDVREQETLIKANQILLSNDPLAWFQFLTANPEKQEKFLQQVIIPTIALFYYFSDEDKKAVGEKLAADLEGVISWSDLVKLMQKTVLAKLQPVLANDNQ